MTVARGTPDDEVRELPPETQEVLRHLAEEHGVDLREYRPATIQRRMELRYAATGARHAGEYLRRLRADAAETARLLSCLLIPVTSFFRDPAVFQALRATVLPELVARAGPRRLVRAWVVGCATGEEAWSLAMLLTEACAHARAPGFHVLATDLDANVLATARAGRYPALSGLPDEERARHFRPLPGGFEVAEALRSRVQFAQHDVLGHALAPQQAIIASFDLVMCRNVLIYFAPRLQQKALERMAAVMEPRGALVLGLAESVKRGTERLVRPHPAVDPGLKIFQRVAEAG
ncbi:MAG: protein-glutamate O-methyltransferase CheR [Myxococcota bacterium]